MPDAVHCHVLWCCGFTLCTVRINLLWTLGTAWQPPTVSAGKWAESFLFQASSCVICKENLTPFLLLGRNRATVSGFCLSLNLQQGNPHFPSMMWKHFFATNRFRSDVRLFLALLPWLMSCSSTVGLLHAVQFCQTGFLSSQRSCSDRHICVAQKATTETKNWSFSFASCRLLLIRPTERSCVSSVLNR